jgi:hypothetical protein
MSLTDLIFKNCQNVVKKNFDKETQNFDNKTVRILSRICQNLFARILSHYATVCDL